jgi:sulfatase modifying factor 1
MLNFFNYTTVLTKSYELYVFIIKILIKKMKFKILISFLLLQVFIKVAAQSPTYTNALGMQFVLINPGSMIAGKFQPTVGHVDFKGKPLPEKIVKDATAMAEKDAMPGFKVTLAKAFYIGVYEITQEQWQQVMGNNPSVFKSDSSAKQPVENITWNDAQAFIKKLNATDKEHVYRLPAEFEWEYAARAGAPDDIAWKDIFASAVLGGNAPAVGGTKKPNAWGLYDMLGNVWEWVEDYYNEKIFADPLPPANGTQHVLKGAAFTSDVKNATYMTHAGGPGNGFDIGLRIVMEEKP